MGHIYQEELTIPFIMCDVKQQVKLSDFISYCLAVSGRQSVALGRSDVFVYEQYGLIWVVTDYEWNIHRLPTYNETVTIKTEAIAYNKYFCHRMFYVYDETGNLLLDILCYFVLIDFETRKVVPVPEELIAPYQSEQVKKLPRAPKHHALEEPVTQEFFASYFDLDMNGHVNNGKYLEWFYESLPHDFLLSNFPKNIQLKYIKEIAPESRVSRRVVVDDLTSRHEIVVEGQVHAQAKIEWEVDHVTG